MKKLLLLTLALPLLLIMAACIPGSGSCPSRSFTTAGLAVVPGARYLIIYPGLPALILDRVAKADGTVSFPSHGQPCGSITVTDVRNSNLSLTASPASVYLPSPPATGTVTGQSFDMTYGMPRVDYFDSNGYLAGSAPATSVTGGGTWLQANMPDLSNAYSGTYQVRITNKTSEGYYAHIVGTAPMTGWGRDRYDSDGDGWYDDEDCDPYDPSLNYDCSQTCGGYDNTPRYICNDQPY
jgi:hypothetical protein